MLNCCKSEKASWNCLNINCINIMLVFISGGAACPGDVTSRLPRRDKEQPGSSHTRTRFEAAVVGFEKHLLKTSMHLDGEWGDTRSWQSCSHEQQLLACPCLHKESSREGNPRDKQKFELLPPVPPLCNITIKTQNLPKSKHKSTLFIRLHSHSRSTAIFPQIPPLIFPGLSYPAGDTNQTETPPFPSILEP